MQPDATRASYAAASSSRHASSKTGYGANRTAWLRASAGTGPAEQTSVK